MIVRLNSWRWWVAILPAFVVEIANVLFALLANSFDWADRRLYAISVKIADWALR